MISSLEGIKMYGLMVMASLHLEELQRQCQKGQNTHKYIILLNFLLIPEDLSLLFKQFRFV